LVSFGPIWFYLVWFHLFWIYLVLVRFGLGRPQGAQQDTDRRIEGSEIGFELKSERGLVFELKSEQGLGSELKLELGLGLELKLEQELESELGSEQLALRACAQVDVAGYKGGALHHVYEHASAVPNKMPHGNI
jgi:hypothetical protein